MVFFKNHAVWVWVVTFVLVLGCRQAISKRELSFYKIFGQTMGTTYSVIYEGSEIVDLKNELDSVLVEINNVMSTYIPESTISQLNKSGSVFDLSKEQEIVQIWFKKLISVSKEVYDQSYNYFDPSVMPMVNYWGFGFTERNFEGRNDQQKIDEILKNVGLSKLQFDGVILKKPKEMQLDFSALAKGYGVDIVVEYLRKKGIKNALVEIGGETQGIGLGRKGDGWLLGISTPREEATYDDLLLFLKLNNKSVATSGNYRNFYELDGKKYSHTLNPKTGRPERTNLLSATVMANSCIYADAWATAFMAMGLQKSIDILEKSDSISGVLIYNNGEDQLEYYISEQMKNLITENK